MDGISCRKLATAARLLLLLCMLPGTRPSLCKPVFSPIAGDMPKDFSLEVGDTLVLKCTLETPTFKIGNNTYSVNGSHLEIKFNDTQVPSELLTVGDTWVELRKERSEYSDTGIYNCNIRVRPDRVFHICATRVTVGNPPLPVENFRCINYFFMNITCYWEPTPNSVKTDYDLGEMFAVTSLHPGIYRKCPLPSHTGNGSACSWTVSSNPPFRKETKVFYLTLNGTNALGTKNFAYKVEHLKIVKISEPTDFKCSAVSKRSITLSWNASMEQKENPKLLVIYEIRYRSQYEATWEMVKVFNETSHMVQGLSPHTTYTFRLRGRASEAKFEDMWTNDVELAQTTLKDVPEAPPTISRSGFKVQNYKYSRTIMLNFKALPEKKWGGATLQYRIRCCEEDVPEENCNNKTVDMPTVAFDNLFLNSRYSFQLWSLNEIGLSKVHSSLHVDKYDEMLNKPQDIRVLALGSGTYEVSWQPPSIAQPPAAGSSTLTSAEDEHGAAEKEPLGLISYTVFWCPRMLPRSYSCNESLEWQNPELNASSVTLNLDTGNVYQFAVAAQTADKASEMDWTTCVIPFSKELEKITQVWFKKNTDNELALHWQLECNALKSYIQSYQIEVCMVLPTYQKLALHDAAGCMSSRYDPTTCKVYNATDRDAENMELLGLKTNTVYRAVVRASSEGKLTEDSPAQCAIKLSELAIGLVVGFAVGGAIGCTALVFVLYLLARWMKKKVDMIKEIKIQLPDGLDSSEANQMHSYKNNKNGSAGKAGETNRSPHIAYDRMGCFSAADSADPKKRHDSGHSQGSSSSTDELLYKKTRRADTFGRNPSGDSSGGSTNGQDSVVSVGTARTGANSSCDSGAESDPAAPPSPDCLLLVGNHTPLARCRPNLPKLDEDRVRESQDSGLDAEVTPPVTIPSSEALSEPTYSKLGATSPDARAPLLQSQVLATSEPSLFESPENAPEPAEPIPPYSKFGLARSTEEISIAPYTTACRFPPENGRLREGPPVLPYSQLALRQQPGASMVPPPAFGGTDVTVGLALEQPRFLPPLKNPSPVPFFSKPPPSGYVTVGQVMKPQPAAEPQSGQGYSKFSIQPPKPLIRPQGSSGYVPLQNVIGVHQVPLPPPPLVAEEEEPSPRDHLCDADSSSDDVAIVGDDNSNNASLEDFSFSSASGPSVDEPADARHSPQRTMTGQQPCPGYVAATVMPAKPAPLDLSGDPRIMSNGYVPLPSMSPGDSNGVVGDYVTHTAAFDWGRSVPADSEVDMDESGALTSPVPAAKTNGYVMLPTTVDAVGLRTPAAVGFVPGVKPGSSSSQVDCSV